MFCHKITNRWVTMTSTLKLQVYRILIYGTVRWIPDADRIIAVSILAGQTDFGTCVLVALVVSVFLVEAANYWRRSRLIRRWILVRYFITKIWQWQITDWTIKDNSQPQPTRPSRGAPKFYGWLRLRLSTAAAGTFYGWLRLMNSTAAYGGLRRRLGGLL